MNLLFRFIVIFFINKFVYANMYEFSDFEKDPLIKKSFYVRNYSDEHLQREKNQTVKKIIIELFEMPSQAKKARAFFGNTIDMIPYIYVTYKNLPYWYLQHGGRCIKNNKNKIYDCYVDDPDGDDWKFTIRLNKNKLILKGDMRTSICDYKDSIFDISEVYIYREEEFALFESPEIRTTDKLDTIFYPDKCFEYLQK